MQLVVIAPKPLHQTQNQTETAPNIELDKDPKKPNLKSRGREIQAVPNPGEHAVGVKLPGGT